MEQSEAASVDEMSTAWLATHIDEPSALGIAAATTRLIRQGKISGGTVLPTVRALAAELIVSPATVSAAWAILRKQGVIAGRGRQGTRVLDTPRMLAPKRFENVTRLWDGRVLDLSLAVPDPELLPDLAAAISKAPRDPQLNSYHRRNIAPALQDAVAPLWPWAPEAWLASNGGYDGIRLLVASMVVPGDYVAVADPSTPRILDILELSGARVIPVATDADGPEPEALRHALSKLPVAFVYEPRSASRTGATIAVERRDELAAVLEGTHCLIIEDDGLGDLNRSPYKGLGPVFPDRTVLVRSYSKSHGPDLRLAVLGGAENPIERARLFQQFGAGWTSRVLQGALAWMLTDASTHNQIDHASEVYKQRRTLMADLLVDRGLSVTPRDGLSLNVPLLSEEQGLLVLASHGIASMGGRSGSIRTHPPAARLGIGIPFTEPERIADVYAKAARAF